MRVYELVILQKPLLGISDHSVKYKVHVLGLMRMLPLLSLSLLLPILRLRRHHLLLVSG